MSEVIQMTLETARENLLRRCKEESIRCGNRQFTIPLELDLTAALSIIGNLQLALRHPANCGPSASVARLTIDRLIDRIEEAGLPANAELARRGDDPEYDV